MKFFKGFLVILLLMALSVGGYIGYNTYFKQNTNTDAFSAVPHDAFFVAQTNDLAQTWTNLSKSQFWAYLKTTDYFADINEDIETVDRFLKDNAITSKILKDRPLLVAGMVNPNKTWDMAYIVDLQEFSKYYPDIAKSFKLIKGYSLKSWVCQVSKDTKYQVLTLIDQTDATFQIHITLADNILIVSLDKYCIENVLKNFNNGYWNENQNFQLVSSGLNGNNVKFFVNYKQMSKMLALYSTEDSETVDMIRQSLVYSVMNLELFDDQIELSGNTCLDTGYSYIRAFASVNPGKSKAYNIISNQTAVYFSLSFDNFSRFYDALTIEYQRGNQAEWDDMQSNIHLVEKLLGVSIQDDFLGWIGQEITLVKLRPLSEESRDIDMAVLINADDIDNAKAHLGNIIQHINRRTPVKIKARDYRNFPIEHIGLKGFFKMFFGRLFSKIEKPYFTYIEDYVVFANSEEVLHQIIDDYIQGRTMNKSVKFSNFKDCFENRTNILALIQTPKLYENLLKYTPADQKPDIEKNKDLIGSFARIGFQLVNGDGLFKTKFAIQYDSSATQEDVALKMEGLIDMQVNNEDIDSLRFKVTLDSETLEDGPYQIKFDSSDVVHWEGNIKDHKANGIWRTYYPSGNLFAAGNYQYGMLNGLAYFYYDTSNPTKMAEANYDADELDGEYTEYFQNGNIKSKIEYNGNLRHGECSYYYEDGTLKYHCKYKKGERSGKAAVYDKSGKKIGRLDADNY